MIRIKIFYQFGSSNLCKEVYERVCNASEIEFYGKDKQFYFVNDECEDYTHAIIINIVMPDLKIPKKNVIGLSFEPIQFLGLTTDFIDYAKNHINKYYIGDKSNLPEPFTEHFSYMFYSKPSYEITVKNKNKLMSIIVSKKTFAPGHSYRHLLVQNIVKNNLPIDIYGRGSIDYKYNRVIGIFDDIEPYENYGFSICIENYVTNHYFSEKIITPLMCNCMPIYYGCKNINSYIENTINLSGNIYDDMNLIVDILKYPQKYYKKTYTNKNIKAVNLIENLPNIFN